MALRRVFAHAIDNDLADRNAAKDVPYIKTGSQGFHSWTIEYEERHPKGTKARLALGLLLLTLCRHRGPPSNLIKSFLQNNFLRFAAPMHLPRWRNPG